MVHDLKISKDVPELRNSECINNFNSCMCSKITFRGIDYDLYFIKTDKVSFSCEFDFKGSLSQINSRLLYRDLVGEKAMDLSVHGKNNDQIRTIFEDAEYFSRSYSYKLMPITFESVNETIIHIEHNYCHWMPPDILESNENRHSTIVGEIEDRNYKKRKIKCLPMDSNSISNDYERDCGESFGDYSPENKCGEFLSNSKIDDDCSVSMQPLDLSLPLLQERKTDKMLTENQSNIPKLKSDAKIGSDKKTIDLNESNKENVTSSSKKIEVTVSRPGQKEYYEPCEIFINDLAKISPGLIKNDCHEIEIIDRTHSQYFQKEICRTYYIVLESTWRIFENSTERIILTNDLNIGQPIQNNEKCDKPRYLIFDQYSLTESLAKICENKGGSFEYTCLEESKELLKVQDNGKEQSVKNCDEQGSDCLKIKVNSERESVHVENRNFNNNTHEEGKGKISNEHDGNLGISNDVKTNCKENMLTRNDTKRKHEKKTRKRRSNNSYISKEIPSNSRNSEQSLVSEDKDSTRLRSGSRTCDYDLSVGTVKSLELNVGLSEPENVPTKSEDNTCDNSGSSYKAGATELKCEPLSNGKCTSNIRSSENDSVPQSKHKAEKRGRISKENNCAIPGKIRKLNTSVKEQNTKDNGVQKDSEKTNKQLKAEENTNSSVRITRSKNAQSLVKQETAKVGKEIKELLPQNRANKKETGKIAISKKSKAKSHENKKSSYTDIRTRSMKEVRVLRSGKQRCIPPTTAEKKDVEKKGSVKNSKSKMERRENVSQCRARTRKAVSEENKRRCLRKRIK